MWSLLEIGACGASIGGLVRDLALLAGRAERDAISTGVALGCKPNRGSAVDCRRGRTEPVLEFKGGSVPGGTRN